MHVKVTTYDQWTTVPGVSLQRLGGEWIYWVGPVESNLLGTGQRLGFFIGHDQFRDTQWLDYANNALLAPASASGGPCRRLSDGYSTLFSVSKPWSPAPAATASAPPLSAVEYSEYVYFDANDLDLLPDSLAEGQGGQRPDPASTSTACPPTIWI